MNIVQKKNKIIGILGGMGPESTINLYQHIVSLTPAKKDQDHIETLIYSLPQIPDRTQALLHGGPTPLPLLSQGISLLEKNKVDFILLACNTVHAYLPSIQKKHKTKIIDMIQESIDYIKTNHPHVKKVGLLASSGTVESNLYQNYSKGNFEIVLPTKSEQKSLMNCVYGKLGIKAGYKTARTRNTLQTLIKKLYKREAQIVILGCTELSLVITENKYIVDLINPLKILAQKAINLAK